MNYYEELGLAPGASAEEVRQAYRTLARLLHPDSQPDGHLRSAAERQMKRLNEILATLCDPHKRREYDDALRLPVLNRVAGPRGAREPGGFLPHGTAMVILPRKPPAWRQAAVRYWYYILIGALWLATAVAWWAVPRVETAATSAQTAPEDAQRASKAAIEPRQSSRRAQVTAPSAAIRRRKASAGPALPEVVSESPAQPEPGGTSIMEPGVGTDSSMCANCEAAARENRAAAATAGFAGSWLYAPQAGVPGVPGRYRALYIECLLKEEAGEVVGTYRAKYRVPDQAISPEVSFQIRGAAPAGNSARLVWTAGDGARGTLEITMRSADTMGVVWWTTTAGRRPSLSSGEGVLIRQAAP